jgi:hypothetical protein
LAIKPFIARRTFDTSGAVRETTKSATSEAAKSAAKCRRITHTFPAANAGPVGRPTGTARTTTFDKLRKFGELTAAQLIVTVGIEPAEERL